MIWVLREKERCLCPREISSGAFVSRSLGLNLFFLRIMKEHSFSSRLDLFKTRT